MKTIRKPLALVLCLFAGLLALNVTMAQAAKKPAADAADHAKTMEKMKEIGMTPELMQRARSMMRTELSRFNPATLMAMKDDLKLSKEQMDKLQKIHDEAREKSRGVLTPAQLAKVETLPPGPGTCMAMHQRMMTMMKRKGMAGQMKCPMMDLGATSKPAAE